MGPGAVGEGRRKFSEANRLCGPNPLDVKKFLIAREIEGRKTLPFAFVAGVVRRTLEILDPDFLRSEALVLFARPSQ